MLWSEDIRRARGRSLFAVIVPVTGAAGGVGAAEAIFHSLLCRITERFAGFRVVQLALLHAVEDLLDLLNLPLKPAAGKTEEIVKPVPDPIH